MRVFVVTLALALLVLLPQLFLTPTLSTYFVTPGTLLTLGTGVMLAAAAKRSRKERLVVGAALCLSAGYLAFAIARDHHVWLHPGRPGVWRLNELARELRELAPERCRLLTFRNYFVSETGCYAVQGLEYSIFSFFPGISITDAAKRSVLNPEILALQIQEWPPEFAVLTPADVRQIDGRRIGSNEPAILQAMRGHYALLQTFELATGPAISHGDLTKFSVFARHDVIARASGSSR